MTDVLIVEFDNASLARMSENCQLQFTRELMRTVVERLVLAYQRISQMA